MSNRHANHSKITEIMALVCCIDRGKKTERRIRVKSVEKYGRENYIVS